MALSDMYQIVHRMTAEQQKIVNVFHVERTSGIETAASISDAFQNSISLALKLLQNNGIVNDELFIFNLGVTTDFGTFTLGAASGLRIGLNSPSFISAGIRFPSLDRDIRSGQKRFCGMLETDYVKGVLGAGPLVLINDIGDVMLAPWLSSIDMHAICNYVIIKRICEETDPVSGDCLKYRLPTSDAELQFYEPTQRIANSEITSQVSRKVF